MRSNKKIVGLPLLVILLFALTSCSQNEPDALQLEGTVSDRHLWAEVQVPAHDNSKSSIRNGAQIYQERCVACHGKRGLGDGIAAAYMTTKPRDFSIGEYKLHSTVDFPSDEDLYRTVTVGIPAFGMPSFEYLTPEVRWAVIAYIKELGEAGYAARLESDAVLEELGIDSRALNDDLMTLHRDQLRRIHADSVEYATEQFSAEGQLLVPPAPSQSQVSLERGKKLYTELGCVSCHGVNGDGDGTSADAMTDNQGRVIRPRDFREGSWYFKAGNRREDIVRVVIGGMPGTPMPSLDLGDGENSKLWDVAAYVEKLAATKMEN